MAIDELAERIGVPRVNDLDKPPGMRLTPTTVRALERRIDRHGNSNYADYTRQAQMVAEKPVDGG